MRSRHWLPLLSATRLTPKQPSRVQQWLLPLFRDAARCTRFQSQAQTSRPSEPLRILFCGSDDFSAANLRALHNERVNNPHLIESLEVMVRPGKRVGRGYKKIQHPPLKSVAEELCLTVHERDTFTGWNMPPHINLIIAVSFGLFVPSRLLRAAKYGGLNVHPSLLPEFRGAAPLHHTLLANRKITGVTLQTLDDKTFDAGTILAQTPLDAAYHIPEGCTAPGLQTALTPLATEMLVQSLREGRHVQPHRAVGWQADLESQASPSDARHLLLDANAAAPKITPRDRQLYPPQSGSWCTSEVVRRQRIIGPLWFLTQDGDGKLKRVILESNLEQVEFSRVLGQGSGTYRMVKTHLAHDAAVKDKQSKVEQQERPMSDELLVYIPGEGHDVYLLGPVKDAQQRLSNEAAATALKIRQLKVEGERAKPAKAALAHIANEVLYS